MADSCQHSTKICGQPAQRTLWKKQGLVLKTQNANDCRSSLLSATSAGKKLLIEGRARRVNALAKQIAALSPHQLKTLQQASEILQQVIRNV